jgi:hypothetical protein
VGQGPKKTNEGEKEQRRTIDVDDFRLLLARVTLAYLGTVPLTVLGELCRNHFTRSRSESSRGYIGRLVEEGEFGHEGFQFGDTLSRAMERE